LYDTLFQLEPIDTRPGILYLATMDEHDYELQKPIPGHTLDEDAALNELGYKNELTRSFGLLGMIGFSFSVVTSWTALSSVLIIGIESGGPPVMIWSWIGVCLFTLCVAYSMAEM
jgi:choline transport protein